jgi:hypothetical protein
MNRIIAAAALVAATTALSACGGKKDPNALTDEDNRQLGNAAEMLDASPDSLTADQNVEMGNGEDDGGEAGDVAVVENGAGNTR